MTINSLVPLEFERSTYGEGRDDIGNGVSYAHPNNNPREDSHNAFSKDPEIQDQYRELWEQARCHVNELGRRLYFEICRYDGRISKKPVSHMTTSASFSDEYC